MRFTTAITTAGATLLAALAVAIGAGASSASAATTSAAPTWSAAQTYSSLIDGSTPTGSLAVPTSVACPSYGNCVGAGFELSTTVAGGVVMVETAPGQWGQPILAPLPTGAEADSLYLTSVACSSATSCIAVGFDDVGSSSDQQPVAIPFTVSGSSVSFGTPEQVSLPGDASSSPGAFLSGVSCNAGGCTAVGTYENAGNIWTAIVATPGAGGAWTATPVAGPLAGVETAINDSVLTAISCPSSGACEAAGNSATISGNLVSWTVAVTGGTAGTAQPVTGSTGAASVPSVGLTALLSLLNGTSLSYGLESISCPAAGACTAVGTFESAASLPEGVAVPITQGAPGQFSTLSGGSAVASVYGSVSCSDASDCVAVGEGLTETGNSAIATAVSTAEANGSWSPAVAFQGAGDATDAMTTSAADSVACPSAGVCVAGGYDYSLAGDGTTTIGSFFADSAIPPEITTASLPAATVGTPYSATLQSSGGAGTSSWSVTAGSLPAGLTLNAATGVISGTPTGSGQSGFVVTATNAGPPSLSGNVGLSITVGAVASVTSVTSVASVKTAYTTVSGNTATVVLSCANARCAGALKLTAVEHLRGKTPTAVVAKAKQRVTKRTITLASGHYALNAGATTVIKVKLNGKGVTLLHKLGKVSGKLTLTPTGAKEPALIKTLTFR